MHTPADPDAIVPTSILDDFQHHSLVDDHRTPTVPRGHPEAGADGFGGGCEDKSITVLDFVRIHKCIETPYHTVHSASVVVAQTNLTTKALLTQLAGFGVHPVTHFEALGTSSPKER